MRTYLVCYDIADEQRLRRVHRVMRGFGRRVQYSVFLCALENRDLIACRASLLALIDAKRDQVPET